LLAAPLLVAAFLILVPAFDTVSAAAGLLRMALAAVVGGFALVTVRAGLGRWQFLGRTTLVAGGRSLEVERGGRSLELPWELLEEIRELGPVAVVHGRWRDHPGAAARHRAIWLAPVYEQPLAELLRVLRARANRGRRLAPEGAETLRAGSRWSAGLPVAVLGGLLLAGLGKASDGCATPPLEVPEPPAPEDSALVLDPPPPPPAATRPPAILRPDLDLGDMVLVPATGGHGEFLVDRHEVTVSDYARCVADGRCTAAPRDPGCLADEAPRGEYPVNCVDLAQARAWCRWRTKRLCTAREHKQAATGPMMGSYPWGDTTPDCERAVMDSRAAEQMSTGKTGCGRGSPWPVGSRAGGLAPSGAHDLSGNVAEWVEAHPRAVAGGGFQDRDALALRRDSLERLDGEAALVDVGFRCCADCCSDLEIVD